MKDDELFDLVEYFKDKTFYDRIGKRKKVTEADIQAFEERIGFSPALQVTEVDDSNIDEYLREPWLDYTREVKWANKEQLIQLTEWLEYIPGKSIKELEELGERGLQIGSKWVPDKRALEEDVAKYRDYELSWVGKDLFDWVSDKQVLEEDVDKSSASEYWDWTNKDLFEACNHVHNINTIRSSELSTLKVIKSNKVVAVDYPYRLPTVTSMIEAAVAKAITASAKEMFSNKLSKCPSCTATFADDDFKGDVLNFTMIKSRPIHDEVIESEGISLDSVKKKYYDPNE